MVYPCGVLKYKKEETMGNIRIKNLTATTSVSDSDAVAVDGSSTGTKRMLFSSLWDWIMNKTYTFSQGTLTIPDAINAVNNKVDAIASGTPTAPTTDGTYVLKCTVTSGVASYSWVAE